jgi:hypothetical protein
MRSIVNEMPHCEQPQHIADILPRVLARHNLVPADVWRADEIAPGENLPTLEPLALTGIGVALPFSLS